MFTHVTRTELEERLHISHLYHYVSAYAISKEAVNDLVSDLEVALKTAKETKTTQIVHQDGEMCFHVTPNGYIILMLPWKYYKVYTEKEEQ